MNVGNGGMEKSGFFETTNFNSNLSISFDSPHKFQVLVPKDLVFDQLFSTWGSANNPSIFSIAYFQDMKSKQKKEEYGKAIYVHWVKRRFYVIWLQHICDSQILNRQGTFVCYKQNFTKTTYNL